MRINIDQFLSWCQLDYFLRRSTFSIFLQLCTWVKIIHFFSDFFLHALHVLRCLFTKLRITSVVTSVVTNNKCWNLNRWILLKHSPDFTWIIKSKIAEGFVLRWVWVGNAVGYFGFLKVSLLDLFSVWIRYPGHCHLWQSLQEVVFLQEPWGELPPKTLPLVLYLLALLLSAALLGLSAALRGWLGAYCSWGADSTRGRKDRPVAKGGLLDAWQMSILGQAGRVAGSEFVKR